jgi:nicotinate-nucleotide adenylyltransferase
MDKKNVGIFGGSFNPVHYGHMDVVNQLVEKDLFDAIWFMPCGMHPSSKELIAPIHRITMLELALSDMDSKRVGISSIELGNTKNYTFDTMNNLVKLYPSLSFNIIIGSDQIRKVEHWYNGKALLSNFKFTTFSRNGHDLTPADNVVIEKYDLKIVDVNARAISSSNIRENIYTGKSISDLVSKSVDSYITEHQLYRSKSLNAYSKIA